MKYNPDKRHRRTIRLKDYDYASSGAYFITICTHQRQCLFGEVVDGSMRLNALGQMIQACWQRLPFHFPNLTLDAFVVMPNHIHGILVLANPHNNFESNAFGQNQPSTCRGAALGQGSSRLTDDSHPNATPIHHPNATPIRHPNATPIHHNNSEPGVAFGQKIVTNRKDQLSNAVPLPTRLVSGSVGAMVLNFKSVTTRSANRIRRSPEIPVWQRNYYEHIIRSEALWQVICQYIHNNPISWQADQLHPGNPSKW